MRLKILMILLPLAVSLAGYSQNKGNYQYTVDLTAVKDDKLYVELAAPSITTPEITFYMPKMIPGTYMIEDYGRFVSDLQAYDKKGNKLPIERLNDNAWKIKNATKLKKISYWIDDIIDSDIKENIIFPMAATNIEDGKNFVINTGGFFGYFDGLKNVPFTFNIVRSKEFYGSTGLVAQKTGEPLSKVTKENSSSSNEKRVDTFTAENYDRLIDSPVMYNKADTAIIRVANTEVLIGCYSPAGKITAKEIAGSIREILEAQKEYLGGRLPVDKYAFIFYFEGTPQNRMYGALEHSYSSFYFLPEAGVKELTQTLRDVAAHEFFHIVTPLTIHSEEIHSFDFNEPKMSKHLWLYEGMTEYFAGNVQVKYGLMPQEQYLNVIRQKMLGADNYMDDVPFTDISKYALDKYKDEYLNVYQKGALIGMCLDIKLRKLSGGKYGVQNMVADLSKKYGKDSAFKDDALFDEITKLTYPEIGEFLNRYVGGPERLPFQEVFDAVGVSFIPELTVSEFSLGIELNPSFFTLAEYGGKQKLALKNADLLNAQGKALGFAAGDILIKLNSETIPDFGPEFGEFFTKHKNSLSDAGKLSYTVVRKNEAGEQKEIELKAPASKLERKKKYILSFDPNASPEKIALRQTWLSAK